MTRIKTMGRKKKRQLKNKTGGKGSNSVKRDAAESAFWEPKHKKDVERKNPSPDTNYRIPAETTQVKDSVKRNKNCGRPQTCKPLEADIIHRTQFLLSGRLDTPLPSGPPIPPTSDHKRTHVRVFSPLPLVFLVLALVVDLSPPPSLTPGVVFLLAAACRCRLKILTTS